MNPNGARRKRTGNAVLWLFACVCCVVVARHLIGCAPNDTIAGTGSQAGNARVAGMVYNKNGNPASGAVVYLRPSDYTTDTAGAELDKRTATFYDTRTDANGAFSIDSIDTGSYCIEVNDGNSHAVLLTCDVAERDTLVRIPDDTLHPTGSIKGAFASVPDASVSLYIQIYGLERVGVRDEATGGFIINDVPVGNYTIRILASSAEFRPVDIDNAVVASGEATDVGKIDFIHLSQWRYSALLYLNTSVSGADVAGTVVNFPVLVRLQANNFDFSQAKEDGSDVRFAKADGTPLPYEIERYDAGSTRAEIWVNVDTIYGNNDTQSITMYWGNPGASDSTNGAAVFDTAAGFQGVWHLAEPENATAHDATSNRYDGTPSDTAPTPAPGAIGIAKEFNGKSNGIRMKGTADGTLNFQENGRYTVSAWVYSDTIDDQWHLIIGKSNEQYFLKQQIKSRNGNWEFVEFHDKSGWQITETPATVKSWKYLTGVRDGDKQYFYIDGQLAAGTIKPNYDTTSRNSSDDVTLGRFQNYVQYENEGFCFFDGKIDEVRISSVARSTDWIKLCFMNQRENDKLVAFK